MAIVVSDMYQRHNIFIAGIILVALSTASSIYMLFLQGVEQGRLRMLVESSAIEDRMGGVFNMMNDFPGSAGKDMLFLRSISSISDLTLNFSGESWRLAHEDLQQFIERNAAYDEIHIHVPSCMFTVRRISDEDGNTDCDKPNGAEENVISHVSVLPQGGVYVSPLVPYTRKIHGNESTIPVILYGTKISAPNSKGGIIIAVIDANYFLEDVRRLKREGESIFLLSADGSYIANPDTIKEKSNGGAWNFNSDFPDVPKNILSDPSIRQFRTKDKLFTFMRITPTANNFALYDNHEKSDASSAVGAISVEKINDSYWIMTAVSDVEHSPIWWLDASYLMAVAIIFVANSLIVAFMYIALFPTRTLSDLFNKRIET